MVAIVPYALRRCMSPASVRHTSTTCLRASAESLHRQCLSVGSDTDDLLDVANSWETLGAFWVRHDQSRDEGAQMLQFAVRQYTHMNLASDVSEARSLAQRLGVDLPENVEADTKGS